MRRYFYTFEYPNGVQVLSGGNSGLCIVGDVNHEDVKVGDRVQVVQFNHSGSFPTEAVVIGKMSFDFDMSKPLYSRMSNKVVEGVGYTHILK